MRDWESDVALYLLAGFLVLAFFLVEGSRFDLIQSAMDFVRALF